MKYSILLCSLFAVGLIGCASIVKSDKQDVQFSGGPENSVIKIETPDGDLKVKNGTGNFSLNRSKHDIPIKITCPNGEVRVSKIRTNFDWGWGLFGNIVSWQIVGWIVDPLSNDAYNISNFELNRFCQPDSKQQEN